VLLGGATALLLGGCDDEPSATPVPSQAAEPPDGPAAAAPSGDERLVVRVLRSTGELAGAYAAVAARHPSTRSMTRPLRGHLLEHLTAFGQPDPPEAAPASASLRRAVNRLLVGERAAAAARAEDAVAAVSGDLARTLASVAASHAQHIVVLERFTAR
jgi:hypothetical protein